MAGRQNTSCLWAQWRKFIAHDSLQRVFRALLDDREIYILKPGNSTTLKLCTRQYSTFGVGAASTGRVLWQHHS